MDATDEQQRFYTLHGVVSVTDNPHAHTEFVLCEDGQEFAVGYAPKFEPLRRGSVLIAHWGYDGKLNALHIVKEIQGDSVIVGSLLKSRSGGGIRESSIPLQNIEDPRRH